MYLSVDAETIGNTIIFEEFWLIRIVLVLLLLYPRCKKGHFWLGIWYILLKEYYVILIKGTHFHNYTETHPCHTTLCEWASLETPNQFYWDFQYSKWQPWSIQYACRWFHPIFLVAQFSLCCLSWQLNMPCARRASPEALANIQIFIMALPLIKRNRILGITDAQKC